jgi:G3E family GTPase
LELVEAPALFPLGVTAAGRYALFTQHHPDEFGAGVQAGGLVCAPVWSHAFKPDHEHDEAVSSVGISFAGELDATKLNAWLSELLRTRGTDIFRSKGVLAIRGQARRLVFQGIHMLFDSQYDRAWGENEERRNTFVFIGRALDREALNAGFTRCRAD